jgi:hypothetical protein
MVKLLFYGRCRFQGDERIQSGPAGRASIDFNQKPMSARLIQINFGRSSHFLARPS